MKAKILRETDARTEAVRQILERLEGAGYEAYAVGGCVRDSLLGKIPEDWDITTSASPWQVKELFPRTVDTGLKHGTVTVLLRGEGFEVTTYRVDGEYEDARHPKEVTFTSSLEEDLKRRDFTMNAMAYNERTGIVDLFGGAEDMKGKLIRCVGDPRERFTEDALRMMRAIRFSAQLDYEIEDRTRAAIKELSGNLKKISAERIQAELTKLVTSAHPEKLRIAYETGVLAVILPELDLAMKTEQKHPHHHLSVGEHSLLAMEKVKAEKELRLAMLLHDIGKPACRTLDADGTTHFHGHAAVGERMTREILRRLKYDNHTVDTVCRLVLYHDYGNGVIPSPRIVRKAVNRIGEELFPSFLEVRKADILAQNPALCQEKLENLEAWAACYREILERKDCVSPRTLAVTGTDCIALGMRPGREIGEALRQALELVLDHPEFNDRDYLLRWIREHFIKG